METIEKLPKILHVDPWFVVALKPPGVSSQDEPGGMPQLLRQAIGKDYVAPVHRLDKAVGGVMVYALTPQAAAALSTQIAQRQMEKRYLAVLRGRPAEQAGELQDLLFHDVRRNKTYVVTRPRNGVKEARLSYRMVAEWTDMSLVEVTLHTGRSHQIRAQFASRQLPLVGDGRYGDRGGKELGLWSWRLTFFHPQTGAAMTFSHLPPFSPPWEIFCGELTMLSSVV